MKKDLTHQHPVYRDADDHVYSDAQLPKEFGTPPYNYQQLLKVTQQRYGTLTKIGVGRSVLVNLDRPRLFFDTFSSTTDCSSQMLLDNKYRIKKLISNCSINNPVGIKIPNSYVSLDAVLRAAEIIGYPVVLKPEADGMGNAVFTQIDTEEELRKVLDVFREEYTYRHVIIERHIPGNEHRLFITNKGFFAAAMRTPAHIVGDGVHTLQELIDIENIRRLEPRTTCLCSIKLDHVALHQLQKQKLSLATIPSKNKKIFLRTTSNVSMGGFCEDVTEKVHPTAKQLAKTIITRMPAVSVLGIDLICKDISKDLRKQLYSVIELNTNPGLSLHTVPARGESRDTPAAVLETML